MLRIAFDCRVLPRGLVTVLENRHFYKNAFDLYRYIVPQRCWEHSMALSANLRFSRDLQSKQGQNLGPRLSWILNSLAETRVEICSESLDNHLQQANYSDANTVEDTISDPSESIALGMKRKAQHLTNSSAFSLQADREYVTVSTAESKNLRLSGDLAQKSCHVLSEMRFPGVLFRRK